MSTKIIKLTESDLTNLVKRVIQEQASNSGVKGSFGKAKSNIPNANKRNYKVILVKGTPKFAGKVITKGTKLGPTSIIEIKKGDNIMMSSVSPEDKGKYLQGVELFVNDSGKLELFVNAA
jgi:hypothetical protein